MNEPREALNESDLEWFNDLNRQADACQAEANALRNVASNKIAAKYGLTQGDNINPHTGIITRASAALQLIRKTENAVPENTDPQSETAQS